MPDQNERLGRKLIWRIVTIPIVVTVFVVLLAAVPEPLRCGASCCIVRDMDCWNCNFNDWFRNLGRLDRVVVYFRVVLGM